MLLSELLTKPISNLHTSNRSVSDVLPANKHINLIGTGAQAIAYLHKKFPNRVIKTVNISGTDDPSYQFLRLCLKHQNNPYFPKIYSVKKYNSNITMRKGIRDSSFDEIDVYGYFSPPPDQLAYTLYIVTEKLLPLPNITEADLERFGIEDYPLPRSLNVQPKRRAALKLRMAFTDIDFRALMQQVVTDPKLKQALKLLEPLFRHYHPDMHDGNIMVRSDGHWVLMDPVFMDSSSGD